MLEKEKIYQQIERLRPKLEKIALEIYANPEVKYEEIKASGLLSRTAKEHGFKIEKPLADLETAFKASFEGSDPRVCLAFLAEYDALPAIGHACGHNLIAGAVLGASLGLCHYKEKLPARIELIGTPAEEGGGGKVILADAGVFNHIDAAMMFHPSGKNVIKKSTLARRKLNIEFFGKSAHASSVPEKGINALDALLQTFNSINAIRQHLRDDTRIHGIISHGGNVPNVVPDYTKALFYIRAMDDEYCDIALEKVKSCARGAALATGCEVKLDMTGSYKALKTNIPLLEAFKRNCENQGIVFDDSVDPHKNLGSTDMGNVSHVTPAIHPYLSIGDPELAGHSTEFFKAAGSKKGLDTMILAAKALAATALDIMFDDDLLSAVKKDFSS